jgi:putative toxin-antitoxin system antitoxin component (TIGR02293 family)
MPAAQDEKLERVTPDVEAFRERINSGERGGDHLYVLLLGMKKFETEELLRQVEKGFPFRVMERLGRNLDLSMRELAELTQIRLRTLHRRKEEGRLQPDESDRLLRVSRVFARAIELFEGDDRAARRWLSSPQRALGGSTPLSLAKTELGALEVQRLIGRLEHGVFS